MLGIAPAGGIDKKERLITDEVQFDREEFIIARNSRELTRKEFCDKFNKKFDKNISVHMASIDPQLPIDAAIRELGYSPSHYTSSVGGDNNE
jgi:hypothetical protein